MKSSQSTRIKLINKLKKLFEIRNGTETALADCLAATGQKRKSWNAKISIWKNRPDDPLTDTEILNLVRDIREADAYKHQEKIKEEQEKIYKGFIEDLVEYYPVEKKEKKRSKGGKSHEISPPALDDKTQKWSDLRKKLEATQSGIYIFYDSSGRAIYVGKTAGKTSSLWARMNSSFNHGPQKSRQLYRIDHTPNAKPLDQKLGPKPVQLHELAKYFSAYEVASQDDSQH